MLYVALEIQSLRKKIRLRVTRTSEIFCYDHCDIMSEHYLYITL